MRNVRYLARVQLGKHSYRLLAHWRKVIAKPPELSVGERLEPAPEGSRMEAIELTAVSLLQSQQLRQIPCVAQVASDLPGIECSRVRPQGAGRGCPAVWRGRPGATKLAARRRRRQWH